MSLPIYEITAEGLEEQIKKLVDFDLIAERHLTTAMQKSVLTIEGEVERLVPVGVSGRLKNSIGSTVMEIGTLSIEGRIGSSLKSELYPSVMEFGREPGTWPPIEPLIRWVHAKRLAGVYSIKKDSRGYHRRMGSKSTQETQDRSVAFMIARKIKNKGIEGKEFMKKGFENALDRVEAFFNRALDDIANDLTNGND